MIWLVGCNGMLGNEIARQLKENKIEYVGTDRDVDFTDPLAIDAFISGKKIEFIINCAAYTAVDRAENDQALAAKLNVEGPRNLSETANKLGATLIHISTDYVFDVYNREVVKKNCISNSLDFTPLKEDDYICPNSVYGVTKADGEKAVTSTAKKYYILRTAWLYGWAGKNFVYTMIRAMNTHEAVKVVNDQKGTPTFAGDLAGVIIKLLVSTGTTTATSAIPYGIYHCTDLGEITWWDFTNEIKKQGIEAGLINETGKNCIVNPCTTDEYPTPAKRPAYSVLCKDKIQKALGIKLPDWKESLSVFLKSNFFDKSRIE